MTQRVRQWLGRSVRFSLGVVIMWLVVFVAAAAMAVDNGVRYYWLIAQPNPRIVARAEPIPNGNTDADGITMQDWVKSGRSKYDWQPVEKRTFRRGELFYVRWDNCFFDKVDGTVVRPMLGPNKSVVWELPAGPPPKRTATGECDVSNHGNLIPDWAPLGTWTYAPYVAFYKNPQERVNVWFAPIPPITIVE